MSDPGDEPVQAPSGFRPLLRDLVPMLAALATGLAAALVVARVVLGAPDGDVRELAVFLGASGLASLTVGLGVIRLAPTLGLAGLRARLVLAHLAVLAVALANIAVTARLMFISPHDLGLLALLLGFSAVVSLAFAVTVARPVLQGVRELAGAAREVAGGQLAVRVRAEGGDELAQLGRAFNAMAARLEESDRMRREMEEARRALIAAVSHDLRTPVASIRAMVEALHDRVVTDEATVDRYVRAMHGEVGRLTGLIDDLFELSRLDAGALKLELEPGSLGDLLSDTLESLQLQATEKRLSLSGRVDDDLPPVVMDAARIQRVLYNLVQNAIRHTPPDGAIVLEAQAEPDGVRVDVVDTGEGVPPADLPHVFDRFYRGEKSRARDRGGAGLGLAIAKGLVEAHGGRMWAQNLPDRGARFSFTLPKMTRPA